MKVIVGSENLEIIKIVKNALEELRLSVDVEGVKVDSGVANQPLDKEATKKGAINRAKNAKRAKPNADFWIGLEGGLHPTTQEATLEAGDYSYHLVTFACLVDKEGNEYVDEGEEIHLPEEVSEKVKSGEWFGDAIAEYAKDHEVDEDLVTRLSPFVRATQGVYIEYLKKSANLGYRNKVSGIITDNENKFLIVQLVDYSENHWNWPGGGMEEGETPKETILRELFEELGTNEFEIVKSSSIVNKYEWPNWIIARDIIKQKPAIYRGQEVIHIKLNFLGNSSDIKPDPGEIRLAMWVYYKELESHFVIPNQWNVAKKVLKGM